MSHAQAALENKEGAERAIEDFALGNTVNPFGAYSGSGWRRAAWERQTEILTCRRDHDRARCCWEHKVHLRVWNLSQWGITSCPVCEVGANVERQARAERKSNESEAGARV
jgi:hypothetical protein